MYRSRISPVLASVTINQLGGMIPDDVDEVKIVDYSKNDKDEMNHFSNLYHMTHRPQNGADPEFRIQLLDPDPDPDPPDFRIDNIELYIKY